MKIKVFFLVTILICLFTCQRVNAETYPEITPDNLTSHYGYEYLGTLENGKSMQEAYNRMLKVAWDYYCSDERGEWGTQDLFGHIPNGRIDLSDLKMTYDEYKKVENWFENDNPVFYFCRTSSGIVTSCSTDSVELMLTPYYDSEKCEDIYYQAKDKKTYRNLIESKLHEYYDYVRNLDSDYEKIRAIHNKIVMDSDYDYGGGTDLAHSIIGALEEGKTVCEGYAQTFQLMCNYCGVDTILVYGVGADMSHVWNAVKLGDEWYLVDVTWDDKYTKTLPYYHSSALVNADELSYEVYLAMPYHEFSKDHFSYKEAGWENMSKDYLGYPTFSDKDIYWNRYYIDDGKNGKTKEEQIVYLKEYIKDNIKNEKMTIPVYFHNEDSFDDLVNAALEKVFSELYEETGIVYKTSPEYSVGGYSGDDNEFYANICISQYVEKEECSYYRGNTINGIYLTKYNVEDLFVHIPEKIDGKIVTTLGTKYLQNCNTQLVFPAGLLDCEYVRADQVVINEGLKQIYEIDVSTNGIYLPKSIEYIFLPNVKSDFIIYGYDGTDAYDYAEEHNLEFVDLTGLDLIEQIELPDVDEAVIGENVPDKRVVYEDEKVKVYFEWDTLDKYFLPLGKYNGVYTLEAKTRYALTPNTLLSINGKPVIIQNENAKKATYTKCCIMNQSNIAKNGICGENVQWELSEEGENGIITVLTISKKDEKKSDGAMDSQPIGYSPYDWWETAFSVDKVVFKEGITEIYNMRGIQAKQIEFADTVQVIGDNCFINCEIEDLVIPQSVTSIGDNSFADCTRLKRVSNRSNISFKLPQVDSGWVNEANVHGEKINVIANGTAVRWKAEKAPNMPDNSTAWEVPYELNKVSKIALNEDWRWELEDRGKELTPDEIYTATAEYIGKDKGNYLTEHIQIQIKRKECAHKRCILVNNSDGTCVDDGYTGDLSCLDCGRIAKKGEIIPASRRHTGGTATCHNKAVCEVCHEEYGDYESTNHAGGTEVRNAKEATATEDGYTGDIYCTDCGEKIKDGEVIKVTGNSEVTTPQNDESEKPTTSSVPPSQNNSNVPDSASRELKKEMIVTDISTNSIVKITTPGKLIDGKMIGAEVQYTRPAKSTSKVVIPATVTIDGTECVITSIADNAFKNDKVLKTLIIGKNVKTIGKNAFANCKKLKKVTIGKNVTSIGNKVFYKCTSIIKLTISDKVKKIGTNAFYGCKKLKKITIKSKKLTIIGKNAFKGINAKVTIRVPKKLYNKYKKLLTSKTGYKRTMKIEKY